MPSAILLLLLLLLWYASPHPAYFSCPAWPALMPAGVCRRKRRY
jgi:hypothetical protein